MVDNKFRARQQTPHANRDSLGTLVVVDYTRRFCRSSSHIGGFVLKGRIFTLSKWMEHNSSSHQKVHVQTNRKRSSIRFSSIETALTSDPRRTNSLASTRISNLMPKSPAPSPRHHRSIAPNPPPTMALSTFRPVFRPITQPKRMPLTPQCLHQTPPAHTQSSPFSSSSRLQKRSKGPGQDPRISTSYPQTHNLTPTPHPSSQHTPHNACPLTLPSSVHPLPPNPPPNPPPPPPLPHPAPSPLDHPPRLAPLPAPAPLIRIPRARTHVHEHARCMRSPPASRQPWQ